MEEAAAADAANARTEVAATTIHAKAKAADTAHPYSVVCTLSKLM